MGQRGRIVASIVTLRTAKNSARFLESGKQAKLTETRHLSTVCHDIYQVGAMAFRLYIYQILPDVVFITLKIRLSSSFGLHFGPKSGKMALQLNSDLVCGIVYGDTGRALNAVQGEPDAGAIAKFGRTSANVGHQARWDQRRFVTLGLHSFEPVALFCVSAFSGG